MKETNIESFDKELVAAKLFGAGNSFWEIKCDNQLTFQFQGNLYISVTGNVDGFIVKPESISKTNSAV